jgi:uncharacterized protein (UPF0335 family)
MEALKNELEAAYERIEQLYKEVAHLIQQLKDKENEQKWNKNSCK